MKDRVGIVTGGTSGVGRSIAQALAEQGAEVILVARDRGKGDAVAEEMRHRTGNERVTFESVDLASQASIRWFAERFLRNHDVLHVLSNNAAVLPMRKAYTEDGLEMVFGVNFLGHFLLTHLLKNVLVAGAPSRVLTVSGGPSLIRLGKPRLDDLQMSRFYHPFTATLRAAALKVAFAFELARRWVGTGITSNTFHPGLVRSNLGRHFPQPLRWMIRTGESLMFSDTSKTGVFLATSSDVEGLSGQFFVNCKPVRFQPAWMDDAFLIDFWEKSENLSGLRPSGKKIR